MPNLSTKYMGLKLKNPIIIASSGLTDTVESIKSLEENGAAAIVLKSLFEEEIVAEMDTQLKKMSSVSPLYPETLDFYEEYEDNNMSIQYIELIKKAKKEVKIPIIASINCVTADQWTYFPKEIEKAGADALELNLFLLPSDFKRDAQAINKVYLDIVKKVKEQINIPVALKVSYYSTDLALHLQKLSKSGIKALVLFNKFYSPDIDLDKMEITSGKILSSPDDMHISLRWMGIMAGRVKCDLAASTGVHEGKDVIKQILAGANAVQIASTVYLNGTEQIQKMLTDIQKWMNEKGFKSIDEFKGKMSQANINNPAAYERVQFMKYFRGYKAVK
ncbi:MAG: dihydroorotate dehydrogenase-like protein [Bacteroidales bacterium]|nr:dihydroorotate dehydrogenase-like protein [Bacteroidales bacterium]